MQITSAAVAHRHAEIVVDRWNNRGDELEEQHQVPVRWLYEGDGAGFTSHVQWYWC